MESKTNGSKQGLLNSTSALAVAVDTDGKSTLGYFVNSASTENGRIYVIRVMSSDLAVNYRSTSLYVRGPSEANSTSLNLGLNVS